MQIESFPDSLSRIMLQNSAFRKDEGQSKIRRNDTCESFEVGTKSNCDISQFDSDDSLDTPTPTNINESSRMAFRDQIVYEEYTGDMSYMATIVDNNQQIDENTEEEEEDDDSIEKLRETEKSKQDVSSAHKRESITNGNNLSNTCCSSLNSKILEQQQQIKYLTTQLEAKSTEIEKMRSIVSMSSACASEETNLPASSVSYFPPMKTSSQMGERIKEETSFNKTFDQQSLTEEIRRFNAHSKFSSTNSNITKFLHNANLSSEPESSDDHSNSRHVPNPIAPTNSLLTAADPMKPPIKQQHLQPKTHSIKKPPQVQTNTLSQIQTKPTSLQVQNTFFFSSSSSSSSSPSPSPSSSPHQPRSPLPQRILSQLTSYLKDQNQSQKQQSQQIQQLQHSKDTPLRGNQKTSKQQPSADQQNSFVVVVAKPSEMKKPQTGKPVMESTLKSKSLENKFSGMKDALLSSTESISQTILSKPPLLPDSLSFYNHQKLAQPQHHQQQRFPSASSSSSAMTQESIVDLKSLTSNNLPLTPHTHQKGVSATISAVASSLSQNINQKVSEIISPKKAHSRSHHIPVKPSPKPASSLIVEPKLNNRQILASSSISTSYPNKTFSVEDDDRLTTGKQQSSVPTSKIPPTIAKPTEIALSQSQSHLKEEKRLMTRVQQIQVAALNQAQGMLSPNKPLLSSSTPYKQKKILGKVDDVDAAVSLNQNVLLNAFHKDEDRQIKPRRMPSFYSQTMQMKIGELSEIVGSQQMEQLRSITTRKKQPSEIIDNKFDQPNSVGKSAIIGGSANKDLSSNGYKVSKIDQLQDQDQRSFSENRNEAGYLLSGLASSQIFQEDCTVQTKLNYKEKKQQMQAKREVQSATHKSQQQLNAASKVFQSLAGNLTRPPKNNAFIFNENFQVIAQQHPQQQPPQLQQKPDYERTLWNSRTPQGSATSSKSKAARQIFI